jgi:hypothetical protein
MSVSYETHAADINRLQAQIDRLQAQLRLLLKDRPTRRSRKTQGPAESALSESDERNP